MTEQLANKHVIIVPSQPQKNQPDCILIQSIYNLSNRKVSTKWQVSIVKFRQFLFNAPKIKKFKKTKKKLKMKQKYQKKIKIEKPKKNIKNTTSGESLAIKK